MFSLSLQVPLSERGEGADLLVKCLLLAPYFLI